MRNLFSILIFLSLAIAIGVIGRHLPEIKVYFQKKRKNHFFHFQIFRWLVLIGKKIGEKGLFLAEAIVKQSKNLLHLAHFWLIKIRKKKQQNEELREIEAKMELLEEEEKTLEKVIHEDLGREEEDFLKEKARLEEDFKKKSLTEEDFSMKAEQTKVVDESVAFHQEKVQLAEKGQVFVEETTEYFQQSIPETSEKKEERDRNAKISRFFGGENEGDSLSSQGKGEEMVNGEVMTEMPIPENWEQTTEETFSNKQSKLKRNFFSLLANKFKLGAFRKKPEWEKDFSLSEEDLKKDNKRDFSDGIVEVGELAENKKSLRDFYQEENNLIKEVVKVPKKREEYSDEDLGIDREILERKIITKISLNPRDPENYRQLGDLYLKMENFRDAEECYQQVLKIKPRDLPAKRKLERVRLLKRLRKNSF